MAISGYSQIRGFLAEITQTVDFLCAGHVTVTVSGQRHHSYQNRLGAPRCHQRFRFAAAFLHIDTSLCCTFRLILECWLCPLAGCPAGVAQWFSSPVSGLAQARHGVTEVCGVTLPGELLGQNETTRRPQVLVHVFTRVPFWVPIVDPHPGELLGEGFEEPRVQSGVRPVSGFN